MEKIKLLIADDHPIVAEGFKAALGDCKNISIVGTASNGLEAVEKVKELLPDVVLMDISMPVMNGIDATKTLLKELPSLKVIAMTMHDEDEYILTLARAGVKGYLLKDGSPDELIRAVETVADGGSYFCQKASSILLRGYVRASREDSGCGRRKLSKREVEVLKLVAEGCCNKEIGSKLSISVRTVETHRERIMKKLDIKSVAGLTKYAIAKGMVEIG